MKQNIKRKFFDIVIAKTIFENESHIFLNKRALKA